MPNVSDIRQKLLDEVASRDIHAMTVKELDDYARMVGSIASIPDRSYADSVMSILTATGNGFGTTGVTPNE